MIPNGDNYDELDEEDDNEFEEEIEPSLTYGMKISDKLDKDGVFMGRVDDTEALKQAVLKMLNTERYEHDIYSWDYGVELQDLFGMPIPYVLSELKERITDALTADERIEAVEDYTAEVVGKRTIYCKFTVVAAQGEDFEMESEVEV